MSNAWGKLPLQYSECENDHKERNIYQGRLTAPSEKKGPLGNLTTTSPFTLWSLQLSYAMVVKSTKVNKVSPDPFFSFTITKACFTVNNQKKTKHFETMFS